MKVKNICSITIDFDIKTYDIDIAGHVNNIVYVRWLEDLRIKLFNKILPLEKLLKKNCYPFVISTTINYKKQVKIFEQCKGKIILDRINHSIWDLKTTFKVNNKITAHAVQKCVFVDLLTNEIQNLHFNEIVQ